MAGQASADLSEFEAANSRAGALCAVPRESAKMTPEQRAKFTAALSSETIQAVAIAKVLKAWGFTMSGDAIRRHRRKACSCDR